MERLLILADDLTGAVDTGAFPVACGKEVMVYTEAKAWQDTGQEQVSINMGTRNLSREKAYDLHKRFAKSNTNYHGIVIKKLDMGFRGNPAWEIEALLEGGKWPMCFVLPALPQFGTFTLYGNQYVKGQILEKSLYATDPVHRARESSALSIFQKNTRLSVAGIDIDAVKRGCFREAVEEKLKASCRILIFDAVSDKDCQEIFSVLHRAYPDALWAGTLGLLGAVTKTLYKVREKRETTPGNIRCACFCGSAYEVSREQIAYSEKQGLWVVPLKIAPCLKGQREEELGRVTRACQAANEKGNFMVVPEVSPELPPENLPQKILELLVSCAHKVCQEVSVDRVVIIGGETAGAIFRSFQVTRLLIQEKPETGVAAGRFLDGIYAGSGFAAKGGSVGSLEALERMLGKI